MVWGDAGAPHIFQLFLADNPSVMRVGCVLVMTHPAPLLGISYSVLIPLWSLWFLLPGKGRGLLVRGRRACMMHRKERECVERDSSCSLGKGCFMVWLLL